jgi:hypothetical protein
MSQSMTPTIGRKVWYFPSEATAIIHSMQVNDPITPMDASIVYVWHDNMINISVADHAGKMHAVHSVTLIPPGQIGAEGRDYCMWMPYQVKQAAKEGSEATVVTTGEAAVTDAPKPTAVPTVNSLEQAIREAGADLAPRVTMADIEAAIASEHTFSAWDGVNGAFEAGNLSQREADTDTKDPSQMVSNTAYECLSLLTICVLRLRNGFTVVGTSACASPANFNAEIGRRLARERAIDQVWPLLGYELRNQLHRAACLKQAEAQPA